VPARHGDSSLTTTYEQMSSSVARDSNQQAAADLTVQAYMQLGGQLVGYLHSNLRCSEDAYDMAQEVYLRIVRYRDVARIQSLKAFAFAIANNLLRDKSRRCSTRLSAKSISIDDVTLAAAGGDPLEQIEADECVRYIDSIVAGLPPACRKAYLLRWSHGLSNAAIADRMGVSVSMIEKHISRALRVLRSGCQVDR